MATLSWRRIGGLGTTLMLLLAGLVLLVSPLTAADPGDVYHEDHMQGWSYAWMAFWMVLGLFLLLVLALVLGYWLSQRQRTPPPPAAFYGEVAHGPRSGPPES